MSDDSTRAGAGMARLIMDDWKRFFESNGVQVNGVCRAVRKLMQPDDQVSRLNARVAELEAELARLRPTPSGGDQS